MTDADFIKCARVLIQAGAFGGLEKRADGESGGGWASNLLTLGKYVGHKFLGTGVKGAAGMLNTAGRLLGATGVGSKDGWKFTGDSESTGLGNMIARGGKWLTDSYKNWGKSLAPGMAQVARSGDGWKTALKWTTKGTRGYLKYGGIASMLLPGVVGKIVGAPLAATKMLSPATLAQKGLGKAMNWGIGKVTDKITDIAANQAYDASQQTAYQIANNLAQRSPWEHLYGMIDPQGYASKLYEAAVPQINQTFSQQMGAMGKQNWQPQNLIQ